MSKNNGNDVSLFKFGTNEIRVVTLDDAPWFVAADVCRYLGLKNTSNAVRPLSPEHLTLHRIKGQRGLPTNLISEAGLYKLVMRSDKKAAEDFQNWITRVVLPAIRKDGGYIHGEEHVVSERSGWRDDRGDDRRRTNYRLYELYASRRFPT